MAYTLGYLVQVPDPTLYASLLAQYPNGITITPAQLSAVTGIGIAPAAGSTPGEISFGDGYGLSPTTAPQPSGTNGPTAQFVPSLYASQTSFQAYVCHGPTGWGLETLTWVGTLLRAASTSTPAPPSPVLLGARRWINGFEIPATGDGGSGSGSSAQCRAASRLPGGYGLALRNVSSAFTGRTMYTKAASPYPAISWERFYLRILTLPSAADSFWSCKGSVAGGNALVAVVTTSGALTFYSKDNAAYPGTAIGTTAVLTLNTWYRVDLRIKFNTNSGGNNASLSVYLNGAVAFTGIPANEASTVQTHVYSILGTDAAQGGTTYGLEADFDDWISADEPAPGVSGFDLTQGSHISLVRPTGFAGSAGWTGDWRTLLCNPQTNEPSTNVLATTTPGASVAVTTDYGDQQAGCPAFALAAFVTAAPAQNCTLSGVSSNGSVSATVAQNAGQWVQNLQNVQVLYSVPTGTPLPLPLLSSLAITYTKDGTSTSVKLQTLLGVAETVGVFGPEDVSTATQNPLLIGLHNAPYPGLTASFSPYTPVGQVSIEAGVYAGNNLGQDILAQNPAHWYFVRNTNSAVASVLWFSSMITSHGWTAEGFASDRMAQAVLLGAVGLPSVALRTAGPNAASNATGDFYQWIAVADPAFRYLLNGAFAHASAAASKINPLVDTGFTPDYLFAFSEEPTGSTTTSYVRGPGMSANQASLLDNAISTTVLAPAAGQITSQPALHTGVGQVSYSCWRRDDGSGNTGWFDCGSYVGNGAGSQTIALRLNGNSPLFAIVTPSTGASFFRDPSHTGSNSMTFSGPANSTTGITGGDLNAMTVGSALNTNGVTYTYFVIAGTANAGNWSNNPTGPIVPVPTIPRPSAGPYTPPPSPPVINAGCISLSQAITEISYRLGDVSGVHWTPTELTRYLLEALRIWNAVTLSARDRGTFTAVAATPFYDLPSLLTDGSSTLMRAYTLKDQDLVLDLEYVLQEPPNASAWSGTAMFSLPVLTAALQRRRDQFLWETAAVVTREVTTPTPDANGRVALSSDVIQLRRAAWGTAPALSVLFRDDEWALNAYNRTWTTAVAASSATPKAFSVGVAPPLTVQLAPPPTGIGTLDALSVTLGATLNPATGVLLGVPDDFAWVTKWGAARDLLAAPGPANDPARAGIASQLWDFGVKAAKVMAVVLDGQVNGTLVRVTGVADADRYLRGWQNGTGTPTRVLVASPNLVGLAPVPDGGGPYTITLDVVRNQPIPANASACYFDGGVAMTAALLDYAEFLARFKEGPAQAQEASVLLQSFLRATGVQQAIDAAQLFGDRKPLLDESQRGAAITPPQGSPEPRM